MPDTMPARPTRRAPRRRKASRELVDCPEGEPNAVPAYQMPTHLTIAQARTLHAELVPLLAAGGDVTVDASVVERIDASCLQVLLSAAQTQAAQGLKLTVAQPSEFFKHAAQLLGLTEQLGL